MTATSGSVHEPYEDGIISANFLFRALSLGRNFADASYAATRDVWWKSVFVGDPLYRPFGVAKVADKEPPKILTCEVKKQGEARTLFVTTDKPCQFSVRSGSAELHPFSAWGDSWEKRDWFFACEFEWQVPDAVEAKTLLTVRALSPVGLTGERAVAIE